MRAEGKVLVSREMLRLLAEGAVEYDPSVKLRFGKYKFGRVKAVVIGEVGGRGRA